MINEPALTSDKILLQLYAQKQDPEAFAEIVKRYAGMVYGTCKRVLGSEDDAQDVSQECFLELARKAGSVRSSLPAYLHHLARSRAIDAIRRASTRREMEREAALARCSGGEPGWSDIVMIVDEALDRLPQRVRIPIILHYLQGHTQAQVASALGVSQSTVSRDLDKGVAALRNDLAKAGVILPAAALAVLLSENASTAAPGTLMASLGKIAISGVVGSVAAAGIAAWMAPLLGTAAGKCAVGAIVLASAAAIVVPGTVLRARASENGAAAAMDDLAARASNGALAAANAITSGKGTVRVSSWSKGEGGSVRAFESTYKITFKGRSYVCELDRACVKCEPDPTREPGMEVLEPVGTAMLYKMWSDGSKVTVYEPATNTARTAIRPSGGVMVVSDLPDQHQMLEEDVSIWSHNGSVVGKPYHISLGGVTRDCRVTAARKEVLDGDECIVVESTITDDKSGDRRSIVAYWVNTAKGYAVVRRSVFGQESERAARILGDETNVVLKNYGGGVWGLACVTKQSYRKDAAGKKELYSQKVVTYDAGFKVNVPIDDKELAFTLPKGAKLR